MDWKQYCDPRKWHDLANLFPSLPESELEVLAQSIAANGLQNPILLFEGKVLDGRNRLRACAKAGVTPEFREWTPKGISPLEFVLTQNVHRRHLTTDQRAALAAKLVPKLAEGALERQKEAGKHGAKGGRGRKTKQPTAQKRAKGSGGKSSEQAAQLIGGVSARKVEATLALAKHLPEALDKIISGEWKIQRAAKEVEQYLRENNPTKPLQGDFDEDFKELASALGVVRHGALSRRFGAPPFSLLDAGQPYWKDRQTQWLTVFDPVLCERTYQWFAPKGGHILDPFGSECTRGVVAGCCGYQYTGIVTDQTQANANANRARLIQIDRPKMILPQWICCDPVALDKKLPAAEGYDLIFTHLPIGGANLRERKQFVAIMEKHKEILRQSITRLKWNRFVVLQLAGVIRDEDGFIIGSGEDVIKPMMELGLYYYNRAILKTDSQVLGYATLLCFWKGDDDKEAIREALGDLDWVEDDLADTTVTPTMNRVCSDDPAAVSTILHRWRLAPSLAPHLGQT